MSYPSNYILEELKKQNSLLQNILRLLIELKGSQSIENEYLTVASFALAIKKSEATVRRWIKSGILSRVIKVNNSYLVDKKEVDLFVLKTRLKEESL